jgi:hypothetical protein
MHRIVLYQAQVVFSVGILDNRVANHVGAIAPERRTAVCTGRGLFHTESRNEVLCRLKRKVLEGIGTALQTESA